MWRKFKYTIIARQLSKVLTAAKPRAWQLVVFNYESFPIPIHTTLTCPSACLSALNQRRTVTGFFSNLLEIFLWHVQYGDANVRSKDQKVKVVRLLKFTRKILLVVQECEVVESTDLVHIFFVARTTGDAIFSSPTCCSVTMAVSRARRSQPSAPSFSGRCSLQLASGMVHRGTSRLHHHYLSSAVSRRNSSSAAFPDCNLILFCLTHDTDIVKTCIIVFTARRNS